jgi:hypothetical protein
MWLKKDPTQKTSCSHDFGQCKSRKKESHIFKIRALNLERSVLNYLTRDGICSRRDEAHTLLQDVLSFSATCVDDNLQPVSKETIPAQLPILTSPFVLPSPAAARLPVAYVVWLAILAIVNNKGESQSTCGNNSRISILFPSREVLWDLELHEIALRFAFKNKIQFSW